MKINSQLYPFFFSIFLITIQSCRLPIEDVDTAINAEIAAPLVDTKTTIKDMLNGLDSTASLRIDADGQITAQFITTSKANTALDPFEGIPNNFVPLIDSVSAIPFAPPGGLKIANADLKKGKTHYIVSNNFNEALTMTFRIPQMVKNGVIYQKTFSLPIGATPVKDSVDLTGYSLSVPNDQIVIYYEARKNSTKERVLLNNVQFAFRYLQGKFVKGYFGVNRFDIPKDSINISFIQKLMRGDVRFADPKMTLTLENSFGIPVRTRVNTAEVVTTDKKRMALTGTFVSNGANLNYPATTEVGQMKSTQIVLDKSNSNIVDIISSKPTSMVYDIDGIINPDGNRNISGFLLDTSAFKMKINIEVPLYATVKSFEERDTLAITFPSTKDIDHADFKIIVDNGTGLNANLQAYFLDANNRVIDSLYSSANETILKAAAVDANGKVITPLRNISIVKMDLAKMTRLQATTKVIIKYTFSTVNNGSTPVRVLSSQEIKVKIGVVAGIKR